MTHDRGAGTSRELDLDHEVKVYVAHRPRVSRQVRRATLAVACAALLLPACSKNLSARTSCSTFNGLSFSDQLTAVSNMQRSHNDTSSNGIAVLSVKAFCVLNPGRTIDGVYTG